MRPWQALGLGCALALVAALAFSAGLVLGGGSRGTAPPQRQTGEPMRQVYSPALLSDPAFIEQQRRNVEALEQACRATGEYCAEARAARRWLAERGG